MNFGDMHGIMLLALAAMGLAIWAASHRRRRIASGVGRTDRRSLPDVAREATTVAAENDRLTGQVRRMEERIAVLERIATDPADRTAREIEALRTSAN